MRIWPTLMFLFGPFLVCDNARSQLLDQGSVTIVARAPRQTCGQYRCIQNATCDENGWCVCGGFNAGDGRFQCYEHDQSRIQVVSNHFMALANHNDSRAVPIHWPCNYRLTRIHTKGTGKLATCDVQIIGMNKMSKGKIVLHGVQIFMELKDTRGEVYRLAVRKTGSARTGIYRYNEWSKDIHEHSGIVKRQAGSEFDGSGSGDGTIVAKRFSPFEDDEDFAGAVPSTNEDHWGNRRDLHFAQGGEPRKFEIDPDNFAVLALDSCGIGVKFRPSSEDSSDDDVHGLTITVDKRHAPIRFPDSHSYLHGNLSPITAHDQTQSTVMPVSNAEEAFLSVLKYGAVQDEPTRLGEQCTNVIETYHTFCSGQDDAVVNTCHSLLENDRLVKCMEGPKSGPSSSTNSILHLVSLCLRRVCDHSDHACALVYTGLQANDCGQYWGTVQKLLDCPNVSRRKRSNEW